MTTTSLLGRPTALLAVATALSAAPWHLSLAPDHGVFRIVAAQVHARGGDDGNAGSGGGSDDGNHGGGDHGGSGSGGGNGGGSDDNSSGGGDRSGSGGGDDRGTGSDNSRAGGGDDDGNDGDRRGDSREATLSDGSRIEIENGRVEIKDRTGRTIVERPATASDRARLEQAIAAAGAALPPRNGTRGGGLVAKVEVSGENIEIRYTDGWKEEIENGRYQLKDELNRTVIERPARASDRERLFAAVR